jgi:methylation protein EvaC
MKKCLVCDHDYEPFMSFGQMPIANGFLSKENFNIEYFFEMEVAFCNNCKMFQLVNIPEREKMFNENYAFFSGTSKNMAMHFEKFSSHVLTDYIGDKKDPFIVEIGSNDGIMLQNFAKKGIRHLGIEPSENVAMVAREKGINTIVEFFDKTLAEKIVAENGQADAFIAANVMCHIPYIKSIVEGIKYLVKPDGIVMFEDPYLGNVIQQTTYDQIYDEHTFLYSLHSIKYLFNLFDLELIDIEPQETHGGSMRYVIAHKGVKEISINVSRHLELEKELGLDRPETYEQFKLNCENSKKSLLKIINGIRKEGKRIVGYAATSKSTTIMNFCGITKEHLDYICDTTPIKQNKFSPGAHIPVKPHEEFQKDYPEYALLFGYNHSKEIMDKEQAFIKQGGKWITYTPKIEII